MKTDPLTRFKLTTLSFFDFNGDDIQNALEFLYTILDKADFRAIVSLLNRTPVENRKKIYDNFRKTFIVTDDDIQAKYEEKMKGKLEQANIDKILSENIKTGF